MHRGQTNLRPEMDADTSVLIQALGVLVRIDAYSPELAAAVRTVWAGSLTEGRCRQSPDVVLDARRQQADSDGSIQAVVELLTQGVTVEAITRRAGELLMLHACAIADPATGRAVILVGPSGMGKTTVARTLGLRWGYVTDETVAIDAALNVWPYPKPLSLRQEGLAVKEQVAPAALGLAEIQRGVTAHAVLLLNRRPEASGVLIEEIRTVPAIAMLAEHASFLALLDRPLTRLADLLHGAGGLRRVTYREAAELEPLVADLLAPGARRAP